jgi:DNA polymerase III delta prime subunit
MKQDPQRRAAAAWYDPRRKLPTSELIKTITSTIRGDFEVHVDPRLLHEQREIEYKEFINEQFEAIDAMSEEVQILFEGAAGTGKTLLAIEEARRSVNEDFKTLFLCFNRLLGNHLRQSLQDENLSIGTIHSFIRQVFGQEEEALPSSRADFKKLATLARENSMFLNIYNSIVVDEIQDFCAIGADELLTVIIEQNPDARIRLFGDFANQMINFGDSISREDFLQDFPLMRKYSLTRNCRNRPGVGGTIELFTQKLDLYRGYRLPSTSNNLKTVDVQSDEETVNACEREYLRLSKKYLPSSIVILGLVGEVSREDIIGNFAQTVTNDHTKWNPENNKVLSTTVRKFKGLEAQAVVLTNFPNEIDIDLMYTGISRAIEEIVIIAPQNILAKYAGM